MVLRQDARRIIITGAAGFIGFHVAERLLRAGWTIVGIDNLNSYYETSLKEARLARLRAHSGFEFAKLDLENSSAFRDLMARFGPDAVIHLAAQAGVRYSLDHPEAYLSNVSGFLTVLEACRHHPVSHLIYASASSVYGMNGKIPFSEHDIADHPVSLYAATKRANELMAHTYAHLYGIAATGLRFFTVYGPWGRPDMAYFKFARAIAAGEPIELYNDGRMERDFTYIDDVVDALVSLRQAADARSWLRPRPPRPRALGRPSSAARRAVAPGGARRRCPGDARRRARGLAARGHRRLAGQAAMVSPRAPACGGRRGPIIASHPSGR